MRAAWYEKNGAADRGAARRRGRDADSPGPGEVRIKLKTSGVNPSDVKNRAGTTRKIAFPRVIPHSDGAGEIDAVGDGVAQVAHRRTRVDLERAVEASVRHRGRIHHAAGDPGREAARPRSATRPAPASAFRRSPPGTRSTSPAPAAGMTLLIAGGAGAVAHYAIQFAKARGATVIATVSSPRRRRSRATRAPTTRSTTRPRMSASA